jgi:hypothetical protein
MDFAIPPIFHARLVTTFAGRSHAAHLVPVRRIAGFATTAFFAHAVGLAFKTVNHFLSSGATRLRLQTRVLKTQNTLKSNWIENRVFLTGAYAVRRVLPQFQIWNIVKQFAHDLQIGFLRNCKKGFQMILHFCFLRSQIN